MLSQSLIKVAGFLLIGASVLAGQQPTQDGRAADVTRGELVELMDWFERSAESTAYTEALRAHARSEASRIRQRIQTGDFQAGDRIWLSVEGEVVLTDTFTVAEGAIVSLPDIGPISVSGILRSELVEHLQGELGRFLRDPQLTARSLVRVQMQGGVGAPGFYTFPAEALLSDVLMMAGGPSPGARLDRIEVIRRGQVILTGQQVFSAIVEGRTLDQLGFAAGDLVSVPDPSGSIGGMEGAVRTVGLLMAIPFTVVGLISLIIP